MKFEEKLIKLRKENALSQEDLAEKLNVTRQTISKWELGQTKPDSQKIMELAKIFNVSTDDLLNEQEDFSSNEEPIKEQTNYNRNNIIIIVLIAILVVLAIGITIKIVKYYHDREDQEKAMEYFDKTMNVIYDGYDKVTNTISNQNDDMNEQKDDDNNEASTNIKDTKNQVLDNTVKEENNNEISTSQSDIQDQIADNASQKIDEINEFINGGYGISDEYDKYEHNSSYENYIGVQASVFVTNVINSAIQDNSKGYKNVIINYNGTPYSDANDLAKIISKLDIKKKYLVTCGYDSDGYVNEVSIFNIQ